MGSVSRDRVALGLLAISGVAVQYRDPFSCLWLLFAGLTNATVVTATEEAIAARTLFGRQRQLAWTDITVAKRKKNQIILSPAGTDTVGQEIWDRKSVFLDIGTLDVAPGAAETLIARHRPDLVIPVTT